ncbi:hypothetical protein E4T42_08527 [Aureobasidium subglaciale]|uniref:Large ribosomal subunit protein uL23m n=1 Tax=Aureobasidium subglaciale (strain EXF-2481) TaxID=1043005 RepID=A0A074YHB5_AURSE|nr:uncharacterized protein AUEXF2481DRAFT_220093 [Aureobasidium subglaciale EXF-2481]KAI5195167.1 hypothetical protein E4T38_09234 [Aureobasidium subglaciale]KAI5214224.1 hypothetical protein E4T40_09148 [Aureobasidium subglaciale]KAI5216760.1 hypothetical protein E4T41_09149 [Aureobasidium subglaciale]KAI5239979.1 hypothetical protein E4T42_08527 [Aureobasidium subglaciale]KAI5254502.1 hypothetical protein E4T46_09141 [Aureobasidium subglaciale]
MTAKAGTEGGRRSDSADARAFGLWYAASTTEKSRPRLIPQYSTNMSVQAAIKAPFRVGTKEVFLPNFTITLVQTPRMPASFAKFIVPLNMNKLDLRDYLFHVYNVRVVSVRSYIEQQKVTQGKPNAPKQQIKRWFRPRAIKKMTVELESPFVWPELPNEEDLNENWSTDTHKQAQKDNDKYAEQRGRLADTSVDRDERMSMREQAKALLERKEQWKPAQQLGFGQRK